MILRGQNMGTQATREVKRAFFIHAPPREVFRAISEPEGLVRWMVERARFVAAKGAKYELVFQGGWSHKGTVLRLRPGRLLCLSWEWPGVPIRGTTLTLSVTSRRNGSLFRIVHSGFPRTEKWVALYGVSEWGWTYYAMNLKSVMETGRDLRSDLDR
ncbi:MAG: SRPBCC domain-containing protein [Euryarchaeota archaeon]|nr:SRPBCC domain-containing protein [Euryarchaeota archaeon]